MYYHLGNLFFQGVEVEDPPQHPHFCKIPHWSVHILISSIWLYSWLCGLYEYKQHAKISYAQEPTLPYRCTDCSFLNRRNGNHEVQWSASLVWAPWINILYNLREEISLGVELQIAQGYTCNQSPAIHPAVTWLGSLRREDVEPYCFISSRVSSEKQNWYCQLL